MENVTIEVYSALFRDEVSDLILDIQRNEFGVKITLDDQPDLNAIEEFYQKGNGNFWIARHHGKVVGTIALIDIGNAQVALRKMFVRKNYRGQPFSAGQLLLDKALQLMTERNCRQVFLGTIDLFEAARKFYLKNGFVIINERNLPVNFPKMKLDTTFFKKEIQVMNGIAIVDYRPEHQPYFERLNRDWIERYFWMEPVDFEVLQHPDDHIIEKGGAILMASYEKEIAGTVALKFVEPGVYEFTKMAVDEKFRGKKIGLALGEAAVEKARKLDANKIILYSNTMLEPAIALYRKMGFVEIPVDGPYKRSNIKMEMSIRR